MITAVTGGIAEGKSTVMGYLAEMGFQTLSADSVARDVFHKPEVNRAVAHAIGLGETVDVDQLRNELFRTPASRRAVNRIMHPLIVESVLESGAQFVEVPLLIETCLQGAFDKVWVVTCGVEEQKIRLLERYGADASVDRMIQSQLPSEVKMAFADVIIRTNCAREAVRRNISLALQRRLGLG